MRNCLKRLDMAINACEARVVVTLGVKPLKAIDMLSKHGLVLKQSAGKLQIWNKRYLLPLYHPGRLGRIKRPAEQQLADIQPLRHLLYANENLNSATVFKNKDSKQTIGDG